MRTSNDLFSDMQRTQQIQMDGICPRFVPPPPTDWSRVGYGGNGTDNQSAQYLQRDSRFRTTNTDYFAPLVYKPNQPVKRNTVSDADRGTIERKKFVVERRRKQQVSQSERSVLFARACVRVCACGGTFMWGETPQNHPVHAHAHADVTSSAHSQVREDFLVQKAVHDEVMDEMDKEQRLKNKAQDMYHYYQRTYQHDLDQLKRQPPEIMQKRPNRSNSDRMWNGSKDNQFHMERRREAPKPEWATTLGELGRDHHKASPVHHLGFYIMNGPPKPDQI